MVHFNGVLVAFLFCITEWPYYIYPGGNEHHVKLWPKKAKATITTNCVELDENSGKIK